MMTRRILLVLVITLIITNVYTLVFLSTNGDNNDRTLNDFEHSAGSNVDPNQIVAEIEGIPIKYEDWLLSLEENYGKKHLKEMIDRKLVQELAERKGIQVNEKLIDREIAYISSMQGIMSLSEVEKREKEWREEALHRYRLEALLAEDESVPEQEIRNHFERYKNHYDFTATMQLSHILVENFTIAEKVKKELDDGAKFHLLAQEYSKDEETRVKGGYLGYYTVSSSFVPKKYFEIGSVMQEDTYSDPFQVDQGIAIIYLHRHLPAIEFSYEEIKDHIENELILTKLEQPLTTEPLWEQYNVQWIFAE